MQEKSQNEKLFDALLKVAAEEALKREMESLPSVEELNELCKSSVEMDERIKRLIKHSFRKKKRNRIIKKAGKIAASVAITIAVLSTALLSVEATRNAIFNIFINWKETSAEIKFGDADENTYSIYKPTYLPSGYAEESTNKLGDMYTIIYKNDYDDTILFDQFPADDGGINLDNETLGLVKINISGNTAYLFEATSSDDKSVMIWEYNGMAFQITGNISKDEFIQTYKCIK